MEPEKYLNMTGDVLESVGCDPIGAQYNPNHPYHNPTRSSHPYLNEYGTYSCHETPEVEIKNDHFDMFGNDCHPFRQLTDKEKKFLLAVDRGDMPAVRRLIEKESNSEELNINCTDPLGRSGLLMAIDNENIEMIKLLLESGVVMRDALLHAINEEFVEAVELLLKHEDEIHHPGNPHVSFSYHLVISFVLIFCL